VAHIGHFRGMPVKGSIMTHSVRRFLAVIGLVLMAASLSGCIVEDGHRGCGFWHHC